MKSRRVCSLLVLLSVAVLFPTSLQAQLSPAKLDLELFGPWAFRSAEFDNSLACTIRLGQTLQVWVRAHGVPTWLPIKLIASWLPDNASFESVWRQGEAVQVFTFTPNESHVTKPDEPLRVRFIARTDYDSVSKELRIHVRANRPPQAVTNPDQTVRANEIVLLSGFESSDPDGEVLQYRWTQLKGPPVLLFGEETLYAIFLAPPQSDFLVFRLTVTDGAYSVSQDVHVIVQTELIARLRRFWMYPTRGYPDFEFTSPVHRKDNR